MATVTYAFFAQNNQTLVSQSGLALSALGLSTAPYPDVVALPDGGYLVVYGFAKLTPSSGSTADGPITMQRMDANGFTVGPEIRVTPDKEGMQLNPAIAVLADGRIGVVWLNGSTGTITSNAQIQMFAADMSALGPPATLVFGASIGTPQSFGGIRIDIAALPDNTFIISAEGNGSGIVRTVYDPATGASRPLDTWTAISSQFGQPSVAVLRNGQTITTGSNSVNPRGSDVVTFENGGIVGANLNGSINDSQKIIALMDGGYAIVWRDSRYGFSDDISLRIYSVNGIARTPIINVNAGFTGGSQTGPSLTQLANGFIAVSWIDGSSVLATVFDLAGKQIGAPSNIGGGSITTTELVTLADGTIAVTWGGGSVQSRLVDFVRETKSNDQSEDLSGDNLRDLMLGAGGNDTLRGFGGDDLLAGEWGEDSLEGGDGNDLLIGGSGQDTLDGGNGADIASYELASGWVYAELSRSNVNSGEAFGDFYISIENLRGSAFNDALVGDEAGNEIDGGEGDDTVLGASGNDILIGGLGGDIIAGGAGIDVLSYRTASDGVTIFMGGAQFNTGDARGDRYSEVENLAGSSFGDVLGGDDGANDVKGLDGNDWLFGGGASDTLWGGNGNDILSGGIDQDRLDGGDGVDVAFYRDATAGVSAGLARGGYGGEAFGDSFFAIENIWGSNFGDELAGNDGAGQVYGFAGNDNLAGLGGDDFFYGGQGFDTLTGGAGIDNFFFLSWNDHTNQFGTLEPYEGGDTFTDFASGTDKIILSRYWFGFGNIGGPAAALTETHANFVTNGTMATSRPSLIWNNTNRALSFDADGNGATQAVLLGTFQAGAALALGDIWTA